MVTERKRKPAMIQKSRKEWNLREEENSGGVKYETTDHERQGQRRFFNLGTTRSPVISKYKNGRLYMIGHQSAVRHVS